MQNAYVRFATTFMRAPRAVAALFPSSAQVERRLVRATDAANARVIVEFGGGTGGTTRALLRALPADGRLIVIERTADFIPGLEGIDDPRLTVVNDCASTIGTQLERLGLTNADAVVSGIPFSMLPPALAQDIVRALYAALRPGGRFVAYQYTSRVVDYTRPVMGEPVRLLEPLNLPPTRIYTWVRRAET